MKKIFTYHHTITASFLGYVVQAIVNTFAPLLFLTFSKSYGIPLSRITFLITFNFGIQLMVDLASAAFVDRIGYRVCAFLANFFSAAGLLLLSFLPAVMENSFAGLLIAVVIYAVGGGLLEVIISPIVEACPSDNKETTMSLLHSFYCWGCAAVITISTVFFNTAGVNSWPLLSRLWAIVPIIDAVLFLLVPLYPIVGEKEESISVGGLFRTKTFWILMLMMTCAGACEQAVSQWASAYAESALGVPKAAGDLAGPLFFAILMGSSRTIYGKFGQKLDLRRFMRLSALLCTLSYLMIGLAPHPAAGLLGCGLCGFSVGIFWPGTFSIASAALRKGGTALFAFLALAGDLGCSGGPTYVGLLAGDSLERGILLAVIFPVLMLLCLLLPGESSAS